MKKGRKFYENENLIIYVGTAIFFILAISVGIVMYMTTKANSKIGNEIGKSTTENIENVEDASSNMGKTVEEQERIADQKNDKISKKTETTATDIIENTTNTKKDENKAEAERKENTVKTETTANATENTQVTEEKKPLTFTKPTEGEIIAEFAQENLIYSDTLKEELERYAQLCSGKELTEEVIDKAAQIAKESCSPISDIRASKEYRSEMVRVFTKRAIKKALEEMED